MDFDLSCVKWSNYLRVVEKSGKGSAELETGNMYYQTMSSKFVIKRSTL